MRRLSLLVSLLPGAAYADVPIVVTDIAPVHSLVAQVMGDLGAPQNLIDPTLSPHDFNLKPSQARAVQDANLLVMVGHELTPWLADRAEEMMSEGQILVLLDTSPVLIEPGDAHEEHDHVDHDDHDEHDHDAHAEGDEHTEHDHDAQAEHDDHDEHDHEKHADHDAHAEHDEHDDHASVEGHEGHNHTIDPHAWLSLDNAGAWVDQIAMRLAEIDPENAAIYQANASTAQSELQQLDERANDMIAPVRGESFLVYHDAYNYFARHYGVLAKGTLASNEGAAPSVADVRDARELIEHDGVTCFFTEPQFSAAIVATATEGLGVTIEALDPLGVELELGPNLYGELIENMAGAFNRCLSS